MWSDEKTNSPTQRGKEEQTGVMLVSGEMGVLFFFASLSSLEIVLLFNNSLEGAGERQCLVPKYLSRQRKMEKIT